MKNNPIFKDHLTTADSELLNNRIHNFKIIDTNIPDCENIEKVTTEHANLLNEA